MLTLRKPDISKLPGGWEPPHPDFFIAETGITKKEHIIQNAFILHDLISQEHCNDLIRMMQSSPSIMEVSIQGRKDIPDARIGSTRTTMWSPALADMLWPLFEPFLTVRTMTDTSSTDWWQVKPFRNWEPFSISPLLRFMRYEKGGEHYAHYDAAYIYENPRYRTLMSFVIYLTTNKDGGATRFIKDNQEHKPVWERDHEDWLRPCTQKEVICSVPPVKGNVLVFDHRICHDVEQYCGENPRIIIRGDVTFKAID